MENKVHRADIACWVILKLDALYAQIVQLFAPSATSADFHTLLPSPSFTRACRTTLTTMLRNWWKCSSQHGNLNSLRFDCTSSYEGPDSEPTVKKVHIQQRQPCQRSWVRVVRPPLRMQDMVQISCRRQPTCTVQYVLCKSHGRELIGLPLATLTWIMHSRPIARLV